MDGNWKFPFLTEELSPPLSKRLAFQMGIPAHPCLQRRNLKIHNLPTIFGLSCHLCHCLCRTECFLVIQTFPWSRCKLAEIALAGVVSRETSSSTLLRNRARRRDRCRGRGTLKLSARLSSFTLQIQTDRKTTYIHMDIMIWIAVVKTHKSKLFSVALVLSTQLPFLFFYYFCHWSR